MPVNANQTSLEGHISANFVHMLFDWLDEQGADAVRVLGVARPSPGELNRVPIVKWRDMLDKAYAAYPRDSLPIEIGQRIKPANTGLLGYIALCCATLGEAFARLQQFEHLVYAVNRLTVTVDDRGVVLQWDHANGRPGPLVDSVAIASLVSFNRGLIGNHTHPLAVQFINPAPKDMTSYDAFFQCPVRFGQDTTQLIFPTEYLGLPLAQPDPMLRSILDAQAVRLLGQIEWAHEPVPGMYRLLQEVISAGQPTLAALAGRLHMSGRTLQRRLADHGTTFQQVLDETRFNMAKAQLLEPGLSLFEVAMMLAYADQSAFNHAFKRMAGVSPGEYRQQHRPR